MTHSYKSLAVHNSACNEFYYRFQDCQNEHPFGKFLGYCSDLHKAMTLCIREQRVINREKNHKLAQEQLERRRQILRNERAAEDNK